MTDSYFPQHGDSGYRTTQYDLELDYRPHTGRLSGRARISAVAERQLSEVALDLGPFRVNRVLVDGGRPARYTHRDDKLRVGPPGRCAPGPPFTVEVRYTGVPRPVRTRDWGDLGWEQLEDGALVARQPIGAPSWFPCNDRPGDKAALPDRGDRRRRRTPWSPTAPLASRTISASTTTWVYEQPAPMATLSGDRPDRPVRTGRRRARRAGCRSRPPCPAACSTASSTTSPASRR